MNFFEKFFKPKKATEKLTIKYIVDEKLSDQKYLKFLKDFKFNKTSKSFTQKTDFGFYRIEVEIYKSYDSKRDELAYCLRPIFYIRFDILSDWFEKYSFKEIKDQRNNGQVYFDGITKEEYLFLESGKNLEKDFNSFFESIGKDAKTLFDKYKSLSDYYYLEVEPIIEGKKELRDNGADWIFEMLYGTKLVCPEKYNDLKSVIQKQVNFMRSRSEPNIAEYETKFEEIYNWLENE